MYLVDTNVVSELARPRPAPNVVAWFGGLTGFALSAVTVEELAFGVARSQVGRREKLATWFDALLSTSRLFDVTPAIARASGDLRALRERAGQPVTQADMLIAATAVVNGLIVATRNTDDFKGCGVAVVDPFAAE